MTSPTTRALDLEDLDKVVGGATAAAHTKAVDHSQDSSFLSSLGSVAAVVSTAATAVTSGHETAQAAIATVETAAQAHHISTDAALTDLLGETHGNTAVASALTTRLVNGSAEAELVQLAASGYIQASEVNTIVQTATGTLAAYSADGQSALGMSQSAAIDVIDGKIDTAAHSLVASDQATLALTPEYVTSSYGYGVSTNAAYTVAQSALTAATAFTSGFESQNASQLAANSEIIATEGGATAFQAGLNAAASNPLEAQSSTAFGEIATLVDAFSGQASSSLVDQILSNSGVVTQLMNIANDTSLSAGGLSALENAASAAHVSTDLTLAVAESAAQNTSVENTLATEMTSRLVSGAAETELVSLAAGGKIQIQDVETIVSSVTGTLAGLSADGQSALGMSQSAAIDVIDAKIDTVAHSLVASDQATLALTPEYVTSSYGYGVSTNAAYTVAQSALTAATAFTSGFESQNASQLAANSEIIATEGGATAFQAGLNAAVSNPLEAQSASGFGEAASIAAAFSGQASSALVDQILSNAGVASQLASVAQGSTLSAAGLSALESAAAAAHVSTDLTLAVAESVAQNASVQHTLATEMTSRLVSGAAETDLVSLAAGGKIQVQDVETIVSSVTGTLAGLSADGQSALGMSQSAAIDVIDAKIDTAAQALAASDQAALNAIAPDLVYNYTSAGYGITSVTSAPGNPAYIAEQAILSAATSFKSAFESQNAAQLTDAASITSLEGGAAALQAGLNAVVGNPLEAQNASVFGETATIADAFGGNATTTIVNQIITASNEISGAAAISDVETVYSAAFGAKISNDYAGTGSTDLALALADNLAHNTGVQQALSAELTNRINDGSMEQNITSLAAEGHLQAGEIASIIQTVSATLANHQVAGGAVMSEAAQSATTYAKVDAALQAGEANFQSAEHSIIGALETNYANNVQGVIQAFETAHGTDILSGIGMEIASTSAQADIAVAAAQAQAGVVGAIISAIIGPSAQVVAIEQAATATISTEFAQAQAVTESMASAAYNAAGGAATISAVSSGVASALTATENAAEAAFSKGFDLATQTKYGNIASELINSPPTTLSGFVSLGEQVEGANLGSKLSGLAVSSSVLYEAEGLNYLLGQSAVANVLGSHATGDLKTACELVITVSQNLNILGMDAAEAGGAVLTPTITAITDLGTNIGHLGEDIFTGNISGMKADANQLASQFITDFKSLGSAIGSASSALAQETLSVLGNTMDSIYSIISANADIDSAVSWVSTTGEKIGDVFNDLGSTVKNDASAAWNSVSNTASNFADDAVGGIENFGNDTLGGLESFGNDIASIY